MWWKLIKSKWVRRFLIYSGVILAALFTIPWFDTTSVEVSEFTGSPIAYDYLSSEKTDPFRVHGKAPYKRADRSLWADKRAVRRWPDVRSCLVRSERKAEKPDLRKMNWGKLRRKEDVEVCLFRIAASLRSPEAMRDWFISQGMQRVRITGLKKSPNLLPKDMWSVQAMNYFSTGKSFRSSPIPWRNWIMFISRSENFGVSIMQNGAPYGVNYFDKNIL